MELSFAPLEGLTYAAYRRTHARLFPGVAYYCAPFLAPDQQGRVKDSALRDLLPENNPGLSLVPQILCNRPEAFLELSRKLADLGYPEVNLNAGCPSGTVVPKHKGAGMLSDLDSLDAFLERVFAEAPVRVSVKTRLGVTDTAEFSAILEIYRRYPLSSLIIHARPASGMYKSTPDLSAFSLALEASPFPVCYNGNVLHPASVQMLRQRFPSLNALMLGRGALANPALFRQILGGEKLRLEELETFLDSVLQAYLQSGLTEYHCLCRMKELWYYVNHMFPDCPAQLKRLNKSRCLADYRDAVRAFCDSGRFDPNAAFPGELPRE